MPHWPQPGLAACLTLLPLLIARRQQVRNDWAATVAAAATVTGGGGPCNPLLWHLAGKMVHCGPAAQPDRRSDLTSTCMLIHTTSPAPPGRHLALRWWINWWTGVFAIWSGTCCCSCEPPGYNWSLPNFRWCVSRRFVWPSYIIAMVAWRCCWQGALLAT